MVPPRWQSQIANGVNAVTYIRTGAEGSLLQCQIGDFIWIPLQHTWYATRVHGVVTHMHLSTKIIENVAEFKGVDPVDLPPLYSVLDPDALDALFGPAMNGTKRGGGTIEFTYAQQHIRVHADGRVLISSVGV